MSLLDIIIAIPIIYFGYRGIVHGFIREVMSVFGVIFAILVSIEYMKEAGTVLQSFFPEGATYVPFIGAAILFIGAMLLVRYSKHLLERFLESIHLDSMNKILGVVFGMLKSGIVVSMLLIILAGFDLPSKEQRNKSVLYHTVLSIAPLSYDVASSLFPWVDSFRDTIEEVLDDPDLRKNFPYYKPSNEN